MPHEFINMPKIRKFAGEELNRIAPHTDDFPVRTACRIARFFEADRIKNAKLLVDVSRNLKNIFTHLVISGKTPETLIVFPNIPLTEAIHSCKNSYIPYSACNNILLTFYTEYKKDLKGKAASKWSTTHRSWTRLKKYHEMPVARVISRFSNVPADKVKNTATKFVDYKTPPTLIYADTKEDFFDMYAPGGVSSCMVNSSQYSFHWMCLAYETGPTEFYAHCPFTRGCYIKRNGKVIARTILFKAVKSRKEVWTYGRVYASSGTTSGLFIGLLHKAGIKEYISSCYSQKTGPYTKATFSVPGYYNKKNKSWVCGIPYMDDIPTRFNVKWDDKEKLFTISTNVSQAKINCTGGGASGQVSSDHLERIFCSYCNCTTESRCRISSLDGMRNFCSQNCMHAYGYCLALRGDRVTVCVTRNGAYRDAANQNVYYSNRQAAVDNGAKPFYRDYIELEEEPELSSYGYSVLVGDEISYVNDKHFVGPIQSLKGVAITPHKGKKPATVVYDPTKIPINIEGTIDYSIVPEVEEDVEYTTASFSFDENIVSKKKNAKTVYASSLSTPTPDTIDF